MSRRLCYLFTRFSPIKLTVFLQFDMLMEQRESKPLIPINIQNIMDY
jgi:hypothetical protein